MMVPGILRPAIIAAADDNEANGRQQRQNGEAFVDVEEDRAIEQARVQEKTCGYE